MSEGAFGFVSDERGERACVWFPIGSVDLVEAANTLGSDNLEQADFAFRVHPRVRWCAQYDGFACDEEGYWHKHWESIDGEPNMTAVWAATE